MRWIPRTPLLTPDASPLTEIHMEKYVHIENASMVFHTKKGKFTALTDINLNIGQGEFIALIGHSGCGKSTLLNLVAGLLDATDGVLLLANREIKGPGPERGVVFQNHSLLPEWPISAMNSPCWTLRLISVSAVNLPFLVLNTIEAFSICTYFSMMRPPVTRS